MGFHANPDTTPRSSEEVWCWGKRCPVAGHESGTSTASVLLGAPPRSPPPIIRPQNGKDSRAQASCGGWMELGGTQGAGPPLPGPSWSGKEPEGNAHVVIKSVMALGAKGKRKPHF